MRRSWRNLVLVGIGIGLVVPLLSSCWTSQQVVRYCLTEPTAPLVRQWVDVGDEVEVVLKDESTLGITVSGVTDSQIGARDGTSIEIDNIDSLTCTETDLEPGWLTEVIVAGTVEGIMWGAAPIVVAVGAPLVVGAALVDLSGEPIEDWPDDHLCRVLNRPTEFGYASEGTPTDDELMPVQADISEEVDRRQLNCAPRYLAEKSCAASFTHGPTFTKCTELAEPIERSGSAGLREWDIDALCVAIADAERVYRELSANGDSDYVSPIMKAMQNEVDRRGLSCESLSSIDH